MSRLKWLKTLSQHLLLSSSTALLSFWCAKPAHVRSLIVSSLLLLFASKASLYSKTKSTLRNHSDLLLAVPLKNTVIDFMTKCQHRVKKANFLYLQLYNNLKTIFTKHYKLSIDPFSGLKEIFLDLGVLRNWRRIGRQISIKNQKSLNFSSYIFLTTNISTQ